MNTTISEDKTNKGTLALSASSLVGNKVRNEQNEDIGSIEEVMIDIDNGRIAYMVLSFGGFLGLGDKLFAIPYDLLRIDLVNEEFVLNVEKSVLENAEGFDKDNWPDTINDKEYINKLYAYYGVTR
jgi:sporulation protein YlmC with PRC-barrel domain